MNFGLNCLRARNSGKGITPCSVRCAILSTKQPFVSKPILPTLITSTHQIQTDYSLLSRENRRLSIKFTMSGKSWFSLSSWYGSGSQEGASAETADEKELKNGEASAREAGAAAAEPKRHKHHDGHHGHHKKHRREEEDDGEIKYPAVDTYGPITIRGCDLTPGKKMKWCTCGLSLKAPWCDGRHKKTGFKSLKWEVPEEPQGIYQFCNCQYTKTPPFCDGTHTNLPEVVEERQRNCPKRDSHEECQKLCNGCGFKVDF